jgi:23S rRNA (uracil1939-C5)-methyltransferase
MSYKTMPRRIRKELSVPVDTRVESLSHECRGVARIKGKTVFIEGALPGELVRFRYLNRRSNFDEGLAIEILEPAEKRITPLCAHFHSCGGCNLQHLAPDEQLHLKEGMLLDQLRRAGGIAPEKILCPLRGPVWGYRRKARLGVKYLQGKDKVIIGFREKQGRYLADLDTCPVLHPAVGNRLHELRSLISGLSIREHIPQIEVAVSEASAVLVLRHLRPFNEADLDRMRSFQTHTGLVLCLQAKGPETITALLPDQDCSLEYALPRHDVSFRFQPLDFTQVNFDINREMVDRVIELMQPQADEQILDLFCGLGNFSLPLARYAGAVTGVEGDSSLVQRAGENTVRNGITNVRFQVGNLMNEDISHAFLAQHWNKILLDPPRTGAQEILRLLNLQQVERLIYISCNPATLARDAGILVNEKGMRMTQAGVMDMFPHTAHVESIACFER